MLFLVALFALRYVIFYYYARPRLRICATSFFFHRVSNDTIKKVQKNAFKQSYFVVARNLSLSEANDQFLFS